MGLLVHIQLQTTEKLRIFIEEDEKALKFFLTKRKETF